MEPPGTPLEPRRAAAALALLAALPLAGASGPTEPGATACPAERPHQLALASTAILALAPPGAPPATGGGTKGAGALPVVLGRIDDGAQPTLLCRSEAEPTSTCPPTLPGCAPLYRADLEALPVPPRSLFAVRVLGPVPSVEGEAELPDGARDGTLEGAKLLPDGTLAGGVSTLRVGLRLRLPGPDGPLEGSTCPAQGPCRALPLKAELVSDGNDIAWPPLGDDEPPHKLQPGTKVEVSISEPGHIGHVVAHVVAFCWKWSALGSVGHRTCPLVSGDGGSTAAAAGTPSCLEGAVNVRLADASSPAHELAAVETLHASGALLAPWAPAPGSGPSSWATTSIQPTPGCAPVEVLVQPWFADGHAGPPVRFAWTQGP